MNTTPRAQSVLDAFHAELLIGVVDLKTTVDELRVSLPEAKTELSAAADRVVAAGTKACSDFEAMGHGLMAAVRKEVSEERQASLAASHANALATKRLLEDFAKFFWLLTGLNIFATLILVAVLVVLLLKR